MLELIITVAMVAVFFGAVTLAVPRCLEQYIMMKETSEAMEISSILENGLASELGGAGRINVDESKGICYVRDNLIKYFPIDAESAKTDDSYNCDMTVTKNGMDSEIVIKGQPKIYGTLYDTKFYGGMSVEMVLNYRTGADCINLKISVLSSEGKVIAVTTKPIVLYNKE